MPKVKDILKSEEDWCKGNFAINSEGFESAISSPNSCRFCLMGAIYKAHPLPNETNDPDFHSKVDKVNIVINKVIAKLNPLGFKSIPEFNDSPNTTFQDVKRIIDECEI